jgi:hypothetical protein
MSVCGGVIFQPRPDLLDIPPVTVRLQRCDDWFYSLVRRVPICNHQFVSAQARLALKNILKLREKLVIREPQVAIGERFECQKTTERKMDMNINKQTHGRWFLRQKPIKVFHNDDRLPHRL